MCSLDVGSTSGLFKKKDWAHVTVVTVSDSSISDSHMVLLLVSHLKPSSMEYFRISMSAVIHLWCSYLEQGI